MSLATRCTHCGTIFKIVQDQLKVSEGWVRCGRCNEIFNALPGLFDLEREPPPPRPKPRTPELSTPSSGATQASVAVDQVAGTPAPRAPIPSEPEQDWEKTAPVPPGTVAAVREQSRQTPASVPVPAPAAVVASAPVASPAPNTAQQTVAPTEQARPGIEDELPEAPPPAPQGTTEFDLDTSVSGYVDKPSTVAKAVEALNLADNPQPWLGAPPQADVPETDESDALDSRYLMPSTRERKATKRRKTGPEPEFADAEFPDDAFIDAAQDDWASGFGSSAIGQAGPGSSYVGYGQMSTAAAPDADIPPEALANAPTDAAAEFTPERSLEPPSKRQGKPGTRGRDPSTQTPEFMRRAQRQAFWRHPATRSVLGIVGLALLVTLTLQLAQFHRNWLSAKYTGLRPYLTQLCAHTGCQIQAVLRLDDLQVESATLVRATSEGPDNYRLAVVVHNRADIELAWPHVDLTLTDDNGAVIARRAFAPVDAEWLDTADAKAEAAPRSPAAKNSAKPGELPQAAPADRSTTLLWHLRAPDIKPAGYTAELFYP